MARTITLAELQERMAANPSLVLVEALPPEYYEKGHLPGAINVPHDAPAATVDERIPNRDAEIVVYCASGPCRNSGTLASRLEERGYRDVRDYHEGKAEWTANGLALETTPENVGQRA